MNVKHCCAPMQLHVEGEDKTIVFVEKFREYSVPVPDGGCSYIVMQFCPWCGTRLPASLRHQWFETLEQQGIDPLFDDVPEHFTDARWYLSRP